MNLETYILEAFTSKKLVIIYPGRFQPGHKGHFSVYDSLKARFPNADVYIATSNKVDPEKSPFTFEEKKTMLEACGVDPKDIVLCKNPYTAQEIMEKYSLSEVRVIFAVSRKDMEEPEARFSFKLKKDGSQPYFLPLPRLLDKTDSFEILTELKTADKHGYIGVAPVRSFNVLGKPVKSASEIRNLYKWGTEPEMKQIIRDL